MTGKSETAHWEEVYASKVSEALGWYQETPEASLEWIEKLDLPLDARIIDAGGGDSRLVDFLLDKGFRNITVLDISKYALRNARERLGEKAGLVKWICADVKNFEGEFTYDLWHDRACFHFFRDDHDRELYKNALHTNLKEGGHFLLGAFSETGPKKCSGLDIRQSNKEDLAALFEGFELLDTNYPEHYTPSGSLQNYIFCNFRKI